MKQQIGLEKYRASGRNIFLLIPAHIIERPQLMKARDE